MWSPIHFWAVSSFKKPLGPVNPAVTNTKWAIPTARTTLKTDERAYDFSSGSEGGVRRIGLYLSLGAAFVAGGVTGSPRDVVGGSTFLGMFDGGRMALKRPAFNSKTRLASSTTDSKKIVIFMSIPLLKYDGRLVSYSRFVNVFSPTPWFIPSRNHSLILRKSPMLADLLLPSWLKS